MKIKMSKTQWEEVGRKSGWMKQAGGSYIPPNTWCGPEVFCPRCNTKQNGITKEEAVDKDLKCQKCEHVFRIYVPKETPCPSCGHMGIGS